MMHSDFYCLQLRLLWFGQWLGCSSAFRCFSEGLLFVTWQPLVVGNLGNINVLWPRLLHIYAFFVECYTCFDSSL